jgi:hypothetical protein
MRTGQRTYNQTANEIAFRKLFENSECETISSATFGVYADLQDDSGNSGIGYRRIFECHQLGALITAYRVIANELEGVSPQTLANDLAQQPRVFVAPAESAAFVCGAAAKAAINDSGFVQNYDDFPAIYTPFLPAKYKTQSVRTALTRAAFNVAKLRGRLLFVFQDLSSLARALESLNLD